MLVGATGTVFPILFQSPDENAPQWQISLILNKGIEFKKVALRGKLTDLNWKVNLIMHFIQRFIQSKDHQIQ